MKELYTIYTSTDASELYNSLYFFKAITDLPKEYKNVRIRDLVCVMLFMRGELEYNFVKHFVEKTLKLIPDEKREMNPKMDLELRDRLKMNTELPVHFRKLFEIEHKGYITTSTMTTDFKDFNRNP